MSDWSIPLSDLDYDEQEEEAVLRILRSKWLSMGAEVHAFEEEFRVFNGISHAFAVANATAALHLSYLAAGLGPGDEVIQPAINFVAAANMTLAVGAIPIFADIIGLDEPTIDPTEIERLITPRTKAVVPMHYGGYLCQMAAIQAICQKHGLVLIEDACHAVGAHDSGGRMAGALGDVGCFSFFGNKNIATGEGGMITTCRDDFAERLRLLRSHGMTTLTWDRHKGHASSYNVTLYGYNYRLDEIHAALGRVQLRKLVHNNERRRRLTTIYRKRLSDLPGWIVPFGNHQGESSHHLMVVVAPDSETRWRMIQALRQARIQTSMHYPCIIDFDAYTAFRSASLELSQSYAYARQALTLPLFPGMTNEQVEEVCAIMHSVPTNTTA